MQLLRSYASCCRSCPACGHVLDNVCDIDDENNNHIETISSVATLQQSLRILQIQEHNDRERPTDSLVRRDHATMTYRCLGTNSLLSLDSSDDDVDDELHPSGKQSLLPHPPSRQTYVSNTNFTTSHRTTNKGGRLPVQTSLKPKTSFLTHDKKNQTIIDLCDTP